MLSKLPNSPSFDEFSSFTSALEPTEPVSSVDSLEESKLVSLDLVETGSVATVVKIDKSCPRLYRRLNQLGLVVGTKLKVVRVAPLGCPVQIELRGFCLALRLREAAAISVLL